MIFSSVRKELILLANTKTTRVLESYNGTKHFSNTKWKYIYFETSMLCAVLLVLKMMMMMMTTHKYLENAAESTGIVSGVIFNRAML